MKMTPRQIVEKVLAVDVPLTDMEKLMWYERWKNENLVRENTPANIDMFKRYAEKSVDYYYSDDGTIELPPKGAKRERCGNCFLWQRKKDTCSGTCVNGKESDQLESCEMWIPKRGMI